MAKKSSPVLTWATFLNSIWRRKLFGEFSLYDLLSLQPIGHCVTGFTASLLIKLIRLLCYEGANIVLGHRRV